MPEQNLENRLRRIETLESELLRKGQSVLKEGTRVGEADQFIIGALKRTLAQSRGFRDLITSRNFPCAAAILRLQIDTAMRVNALKLVDDVEGTCSAVLRGVNFDKLIDADKKQMRDRYLRQKLAKDHPWIDEVYEQTSSFIHLSDRHFQNAIHHTDDEQQIVYFLVSGHDPSRPADAYNEVVDTFFNATKLAGMLILAFWMARHNHDAVVAAMEDFQVRGDQDDVDPELSGNS